MATTHNQGLGEYGERVAARHLVEAGMTVLDRNWRCDLGEVDLLLRDGDVLVACEVKTRSGEIGGHPLEAVDSAKAERSRHLAVRWLRDRGMAPREVRVDLVGVLLPAKGRGQVTHVRGVG